MRKGGLAIVIILVVALIIGFLFMRNMNIQKEGGAQNQNTQQDLEKMAQDAVDLINENMKNSEIVEGFKDKAQETIDKIEEQFNQTQEP